MREGTFILEQQNDLCLITAEANIAGRRHTVYADTTRGWATNREDAKVFQSQGSAIAHAVDNLLLDRWLIPADENIYIIVNYRSRRVHIYKSDTFKYEFSFEAFKTLQALTLHVKTHPQPKKGTNHNG